jgi:hypothetical protein
VEAELLDAKGRTDKAHSHFLEFEESVSKDTALFMIEVAITSDRNVPQKEVEK